MADIIGDWREEMLLRQSDNSALILFTTTTITTHRLYTLMHDPHYRAAISWQNAAYNQPPHLGFFLGAGVDKAPKPNITLVGHTETSALSFHRATRILRARLLEGGLSVDLPWSSEAEVTLVNTRGRVLSRAAGVGSAVMAIPDAATGLAWVRAIGPDGESAVLPISLVR